MSPSRFFKMAESRIRSGKQTEIRGGISDETNVKHVRKNKDSRRQVSIPSYTGLGLMVRLLLLIIYIAVHIHGAITFKNCPNPEKYFRGSFTFGGPWKYLTYINLVCVVHASHDLSLPPFSLSGYFNFPHSLFHPISNLRSSSFFLCFLLNPSVPLSLPFSSVSSIHPSLTKSTSLTPDSLFPSIFVHFNSSQSTLLPHSPSLSPVPHQCPPSLPH